MPLVKNVFIRIKADGAAQAKADMADLAERARAISRMDPTIKLGVTDKSALERLRALRLELDAMRISGDKIGLARVANDLKTLGENANAPRLKLMALRAEMMAVRAAANQAATAVDGAGTGGGTTGILGRTGVQIGLGAALVALLSGLGGLIPDLIAATAGIAAFGGLAYPTFTAVIGAIGDTQKQLAKLPPGERAIVEGIQNLLPAFHSMVVAIRPLAVQIMGDFLKIANELLPAILPLATTAGQALAGLFGHLADSLKLTNTHTSIFVDHLGHVHKLVTSTTTPFGQFVKQMTALAGPTITTIGEGLGKIVVALGKLLVALVNPEALRSAKYLFLAIASVITNLAAIISGVTKAIVVSFHAIAVAFDKTRHFLAETGHGIAHDFDWLRHFTAEWFDAIVHFFEHLGHDAFILEAAIGAAMAGAIGWVARFREGVARDIAEVVRWYMSLPGKILHAVSDFGHLLWSAGADLLRGLIGGIQSMIGNVISTVVNIGKSIIGSITHALGIGSPSRITHQHGLWLMEGLARGILDGEPMIRIALQHASRAIWGLKGGPWTIPGMGPAPAAVPGWNAPPVPSPGIYPGAPVITIELRGDDHLIQWLKGQIRVRGGGGPQSVQRALGVVYR